jgi:hypothetical protein
MRWPHGRRLWFRCKFLHGMMISLLYKMDSPLPSLDLHKPHPATTTHFSTHLLWHTQKLLCSLTLMSASAIQLTLPHFHFWFWKWFCMLQSFLLCSLSREIDCLIALEATRFICQRNVFLVAETLLWKAFGLGYGTKLRV